MSSPLKRNLFFLVLQFLDEEKLSEAAHNLEKDSGVFFNLSYLEELAMAGRWAEAEDYLAGFTAIDDNDFSTKAFFEIRKQNCLESLDQRERVKAFGILSRGFKVFEFTNQKLYKDLTLLLTLANFRENEQLAKYGDTDSTRAVVFSEIKKLVEGNPLLRNKLQFPSLKPGSLCSLFNQSSLSLDHSCEQSQSQPSGPQMPSPVSAYAGTYQLAQGVTNVLPTTHLPVANSGIARNQYSPADLLPKSLAVTLEQGSMVMSMDFHPSQQTILLALNERLEYRRFSAWNINSCSYIFQLTLIEDSAISVNKVAWSHDGSQFGVAHSKHIVHLYTFNGRENLVSHLEIDAHVGGVNDLAFPQPNRQVTVVTCGDDKLIKVWDTTSGSVQFTFQSDTPVYSICPKTKENLQFVFSTAFDERFKVYLMGDRLPKIDYSLPDHACSRMAYTDDGTRLFSCGTSKEGETCIVEWDERKGSQKRIYMGFRNASKGVVQFDTTKNRFLAAGDGFLVKFWDMDVTTLLATTDAEGGLPASPRIRFNRSGSLLAVSTSDNCIKILANVDGLQLLRSLENQSYGAATRSVSEALTKQNGDTLSLVVDVEDINKPIENSQAWKVHVINEPSQCRSLWLHEILVSVKVPELVYMNSGTALLALGSNGVHKLWRWPKMAKNGTGQATTSLPLDLWKLPNANRLTNDLSYLNQEEAGHSFALSKNDSYILSTSGGKISLFNMLTFKTMLTFMPPPPAATCIALYPQDNNIIAIGMGDGSINIYSMLSLEVKTKLKGHRERITSLAFSSSLNVLVSAGLDARLCIWATDCWKKKASKLLQNPNGLVLVPDLGTHVQFHNDLVHFLVVHGLQLAIYDAEKLERSEQWIPLSVGIITNAAYSCNGEMIYATFMDGSVSVFTAALQLRCRINPTAYPSAGSSQDVYPLVVAAHPSEPNQFALGLTDGGVYIFEPLAAEGKWGTPPPKGDPL